SRFHQFPAGGAHKLLIDHRLEAFRRRTKLVTDYRVDHPRKRFAGLQASKGGEAAGLLQKSAANALHRASLNSAVLGLRRFGALTQQEDLLSRRVVRASVARRDESEHPVLLIRKDVHIPILSSCRRSTPPNNAAAGIGYR